MQLLFLLNFRKFDESKYLRRLKIIEVPTTKIRMHHILYTPEKPKAGQMSTRKNNKIHKMYKTKIKLRTNK